jgi:hypothetical protein
MALPSWDLAVVIGPQAGLNEQTTLAWLTEFATSD